MMSFLTYITGFFYELWTFAYFDRLCKLEKRGDEIKKKSSPLKLIFSHGGHLGYRTALTDTIFKGDHPRIISAKFGWDWLNSFRGEDFFLISSPFLGMKFKKNLLLWNYCANLNQTLLKWTLGGPLWKLCPSVPSCIQDGHHD
jgi:hypothetical protein